MENNSPAQLNEKIKNWLKNPYNLTFIGILVLAIVLRVHQFFLTSGQALWWDEADYLAYAKNLAGFEIDWVIATKHNSFYPFLASWIFKIGFGEPAVKFLLQLIPSVLSVAIVYFLANDMYEDKRIGLIAAFLMSVFWVGLFNTSRFHVDIPALFFGLLSIYVFWKGYEKKEKIFGKIGARWAVPVAAALAVLTYSIRRGYFLFGFFIITYAVLTKNWKELVKDRYNWIGLVIGLILVFVVEKTIFISAIGDVGGEFFHQELSISPLIYLEIFELFFKFGSYLNFAIFYLFWIGLIFLIGKVILSFGHIKKIPDAKPNLFNVLVIILTLAFFIFVLRNSPDAGGRFVDEPRWYLPLAFSAFICVAKAGTFIVDFTKKYNKHIGAIILIILIGIGGYYQYNLSEGLIKSKVESYSGIREAGLFLKEISNKDDVILTLGQPQVEYYSERKTLNAWKWIDASRESEEHFYQSMNKLKEQENIKYILITFSEPAYPLWMRKVNSASNGQVISWEIPFMQTKIDFTTGEQQINREGKYENLKFRLVDIKQEVFIYEVIRN